MQGWSLGTVPSPNSNSELDHAFTLSQWQSEGVLDVFTEAVQVRVLWKDGTDFQVLVRKLYCRGKRERERELY